MPDVISFPRTRAGQDKMVERSAPHQRFCALRSHMLEAWTRWMEEHPPALDVAQELEATGSAMRQVHQLLREDGA